MTKATLAQASAWLLAVRAKQDIRETARDAKLACHGIAASMIKTYDASAFTPDSSEYVSATLKWFREPDIRERLDAWCAAQRPVERNAPSPAVVEVMMRQCSGNPGPLLRQWMAERGVALEQEPAPLAIEDGETLFGEI